MVFGGIVSSPRASLSGQQALELANLYLENANNTSDNEISLVLCHDTEVSLNQAKKSIKHSDNPGFVDEIISTYIELGNLLQNRGHEAMAQVSYKKAEKLGGHAQDPIPPIKTSRSGSLVKSIKDTFHPSGSSSSNGSVRGSCGLYPSQNKRYREGSRREIATIPANIFEKNVSFMAPDLGLPDPDERLSNTPQLVCCLGLLKGFHSSDELLDPAARKWLQIVAKDPDEKSRLHTMATDVIRAFVRDEIKDDKTVAEVVCLAPVLNKDMFHDLLSEFYSGIDHSGLLNFHQLEGLAQLIQGADPGHLSADDLVKILVLLSDRLGETHHQSTQNLYQLTMAISNVLDAMADARVTGLDRERLHEPLSMYLQELQDTKDPYLVYQAAYAYQALQCVPDDETTWQTAMRHTGKLVRGISGLVSAAKGFDLMKFIEGLEDIGKGLSGVTMVVDVVKTSFNDGLEDSGQTFLEYLKEGLSFERKRDWYSALRGADALIRDGELATFKKLVCEAPCRLDAAFQWGICQRLGEIVANPAWDADTRQSAIAFLGEIYRDDATWGQQMNVKQWILNILMQMVNSSGTGSQCMWSEGST
ncbi:hypothetical protein BGX34_006671 [Mortierella sp. NVP85]|nr:hypothetical protein BGX34_006671 [Mortierella sp. NVP85]